jgi:hypothetical protein
MKVRELVEKEIAGFKFGEVSKIGGRKLLRIVGYRGIHLELTDDLEKTSKFTLTPGQGYPAEHGLTFSQAYTGHTLRLKYNQLTTIPSKAKHGRKA